MHTRLGEGGGEQASIAQHELYTLMTSRRGADAAP